MTNRINVAALCVAGLSTINIAAQTQGKAVPQRSSSPNIVFILADDMGIGDLGCYGQKRIKTPNIDKLASQGLRFTHHYSGSTVSAPSRCALLTGKDMGHAYIRGNKGTEAGYDSSLPAEQVTVAELLKTKNYATACVGKWGLGGPQSEGHPNNQGFDYFFGYLGQGAAHRYYPEYMFENNDKVMLNGKVYSHFMIMDKGIDFIKENSEKPFFVYFAITPPHADLDYPDISQYDGQFEEPPLNTKTGSYKKTEKPRATYASMITEIDSSVGRVVDILREQGVLDNTIIIFSSDNGVHSVGGHDPDYFDSNGPFRGYKRDLYEGGIRTPFVVSWKNVIKQGQTVDHISTFWDFLPTVCDITSLAMPEGVNGISYLPTLLSDPKSQKKHDHIYYEFYEQGGKQSIMQDGWKLVRLNMDTPAKMVEELYNINNDIGETKNIIERNKDKADQLRALAERSRTESDLFKWKK